LAEGSQGPHGALPEARLLASEQHLVIVAVMK
jgi:hypothetical protein